MSHYIDVLSKMENTPSKAYLYFDLIRSFLVHGSTVSDYFDYRFWEKSYIAKKNSMTARRNNRFYASMNERLARHKLNYKSTFNKEFDEYLRRPWISIPEADVETFQRFVQDNEAVFVKRCHLGGGVGIRKLHASEVSDYAELYQELCQQGEWVVEGCVVQHEIMATIHPHSLNTCRVITFFDEKDVYVVGAALRFGSGGSVIDNHTAGGMTALVDVETGVVCSSGTSTWDRNIVRHPDTGVILPGFQIPYWKEAIATVKEAAASLQGIHYVGWDVGFTPDGVCLIEANPSGDPGLLQEPMQRGVRPLYDWMLDHLPQ